MEKWEIDVCKRNPELNQRRLALIERLDNFKIEMDRLKFQLKEKSGDKKYEILKNKSL